MKIRSILFSLLFLVLVESAQAQYTKLQGWCEDGGQKVTTSGLISVTSVQRSYPSCVVSIFNGGTKVVSSIYSDSTGTAKANPFTAATTGQWFFYATPGSHYDVTFSGDGIASPFTLADQIAPFAGSGTTNFVTKWATGSSLGNAVFKDDGTNVYPNTTNVNDLGLAANLWKAVRGTNLYGDTGIYLNASQGTAFGVATQAAVNSTTLKLGDTANWTTITLSPGTATPTATLTSKTLTVQRDQNDLTLIQIVNSTTGTDAQGEVVALSADSGNTTVEGTTAIGSTSSSFTVTDGILPHRNIGPNSSYLFSGTRMTGGLFIQSEAAAIHFRAKAASNSRVDICVLDYASVVLTCDVDQNNGSYMIMKNATAGTLAQAVLVAQSGADTTHATLIGSTSSSFTTANGIPASAGYVYTGSANTAGLYVESAAGAIRFLSGGTTQVLRLNTSGTDRACIYINGSLRLLTLSGSNVVDGGACP